MAKQLRNIMGAGVAPLMATQINGTVGDTLTATGSTQATALLCPNDVNVFTNVASGTGCVLPANPAPGDEILVGNLGANALSVYAAPGGAIQAGSVNAAFSLTAGKCAKFIARSGSLNWIVVLSA